jgi:uncharacterized membrane protein
MNAHDLIGLVSVFFAGLLAGEEFVVRFGVRGPLTSLPDGPHILARQALIRTLRVLVPVLYLLTLSSAVAATCVDGPSYLPVRAAGVAALLVWLALTLGGTVPINVAAIEWDADAPPANWRSQIERWERLNTLRTAAAIIAFSLLLTSLTLAASTR